MQHPSRPSSGISQWLLQIDRAMQFNNMPEAIRLARTALDFGHVHPALLNLRAMGKRLENRNEEALADLIRSCEFNPRQAWTLADLADCLNGMGRLHKALEAAEEAIAVDRKYSKAWFQKGLAHQAMRDLDKARTSYLSTVQLEPTHADAHARLATMAADQAAFTEARRHAMLALRSAPAHPMPVLALATADMAEGLMADAEKRLAVFLRRQDVPAPMRAVAVSQLGDIRDAEGRTDEAFDAYAQSRSIWAGYYVPTWPDSELGRDQALRLGAVLAHMPAGIAGSHG